MNRGFYELLFLFSCIQWMKHPVKIQVNRIMQNSKARIATFFFVAFVVSPCLVYAQQGWFPLTTGPISSQFTSIYFINADTGLVSCGDLGNFRTTDEGRTWTAIAIFGSHYKFFNNNKLGFSYPSVYKTTDGGFNWTYENLSVSDIDFPSDSIGYIVRKSSDTNAILLGKTNNGGKSWGYSHIPVIPPHSKMRVVDVHTLAFRDNEHGFVTVEAEAMDGSGGGPIGLSTSDGGNNWIGGNGDGYQLLFLHDSTWISTHFHSQPTKTNDDFNTLRYLDSIVTFDSSRYDCYRNTSYAMSKFDTNNILGIDVYFGGGQIIRSTDAGESWHIQFCFIDAPYDVYAAVSLPTKLVGYAVCVDSQIYKTIDGGGPPFTNSVNSSTENSKYTLLSNPITSSADFQFEALKAPVVFELFDLLGRQLLHQELFAGQTSLHLDMQHYPAGIYFARLGNETVWFIKM